MGFEDIFAKTLNKRHGFNLSPEDFYPLTDSWIKADANFYKNNPLNENALYKVYVAMFENKVINVFYFDNQQFRYTIVENTPSGTTAEHYQF